jgi:nucleoside-diphosphate-sugar epimerase
MELLVTGAGGLLGRHLVTELLARGDRVRALGLPGEDLSWLEARGGAVYRGDVREPETLHQPMRGTDAVLHLAGMMGVWRPLRDYRAVNVTGTENVCRAALDNDVARFVHVSSWTVYGLDQGAPCSEDHPLTPFPDPYPVTKAEGDRLVQRLIDTRGLPAVIIRPGTFIGPGDRLHFGRMADRLRAGKGIVIGRGDNALPFAYVSDIVQGLLLGLDHDDAIGEAFNITNDDPLTQQETFEAIAEEIGVDAPRRHVPYGPLYAAASAVEHSASLLHLRRQPPATRLGVKLFGTDNRHRIDKARALLGYTPRVPLREGIHRCATQTLADATPGVRT